MVSKNEDYVFRSQTRDKSPKIIKCLVHSSGNFSLEVLPMSQKGISFLTKGPVAENHIFIYN